MSDIWGGKLWLHVKEKDINIDEDIWKYKLKPASGAEE